MAKISYQVDNNNHQIPIFNVLVGGFFQKISIFNTAGFRAGRFDSFAILSNNTFAIFESIILQATRCELFETKSCTELKPCLG
jgi:hypothetical protein